MLGSLALLILVNSIGIYGGGWHLPNEEARPRYGHPGTKNLPYVCSFPPEAGPCQPFVPIKRWYYNIKSGQCDVFYYGGCEGNLNNFKSLKECQQCCPFYTSRACPTVNITVCESPVNSVTKQCLGGSQFTQCGTACPLICGKPPPEFCIELCVTNICQCPSDYYRNVPDCMCLKKECCPKPGWYTVPGIGQYPDQCVPKVPMK